MMAVEPIEITESYLDAVEQARQVPAISNRRTEERLINHLARAKVRSRRRLPLWRDSSRKQLTVRAVFMVDEHADQVLNPVKIAVRHHRW